MITTQKLRYREFLLAVVLLVLVVGFLLLALLDPAYRDPFVDLAKISVGGFIGWMTHGSAK